MKALIVLGIFILSVAAFVAFGCATVRRDSEVATHTMTDQGFTRTRIMFISVGVVASALDLFLVTLLLRHARQRVSPRPTRATE